MPNPVQALVSATEAERAGEPAIANAVRCSGCGCVWVKDSRGIAHVLGTLRIDRSHCRWISAYKRPQS